MLHAAEGTHDTPALLFGRIVHQMTLEPDAPAWWVVPPDDVDLRTKAGKDWKAANEHRKVVKKDTWANIIGVWGAIRSHMGIYRELTQGQREVSVYRKHTSEAGTVLRRGRIDLVCASANLLDIKTTEDARPEAFSKQIKTHGYHIQAAYYLDLWNECNPHNQKHGFIFAAVEKEPPHGIMVHRLAQRAIDRGREIYKELLDKYMDYRDRGTWPCYPETVQEIDLPYYAYPRV